VRYSTPDNWAKYFEKTEGVQISGNKIRERLRKAEKIGITGRNKVGRVLKNAFFSEADVRSACADVFQPLIQADKNGFFVKDGEKYGTNSVWSKAFGISKSTISSYVKTHNLLSIKGKDRRGAVSDFYPESAIRQICADLLQNIPQAVGTGFFIKDGQKYGTVKSWSRALVVSEPTISDRVKTHKPNSVKGKDGNGTVRDFFSETSIREICADLLQDIPQADENGFFMKDGQKYGTIIAYARALGISDLAITVRLKNSPQHSIKGKNRAGHIFDFYSETDIRKLCADLLQDIPQADENGFFIKDGLRYGTIAAWTRDLGISAPTITERLKNFPQECIKGKDYSGHICNFYPESVIRNLCAHLLHHLFQADDEGFFTKNSKKYGTINAWARILEISTNAIGSRMKNAPKESVKGKDKKGRIQNFYPESVIREICADLIQPIHKADEEGFLMKNGEKYGTIVGWSKILGISTSAITSRIKTHKPNSIKGKMKGGQIFDFFSESAIREICSDLLLILPEADETDFINKDGQRYGTIKAWSKTLVIAFSTISSRIKTHNPLGIQGKNRSGHVLDYYSESDIRELCANLLQDIPQADKKGFFMKDGEKYGTIKSWTEVFGISEPSISSRIKTHNPKAIKGKNIQGHVYDFYSESNICNLCADILAKKNNS